VATAKKAPAKKAPAKKAPAKKAPAKKAVVHAAPARPASGSSASVQYRVVFGKGDECIEGPDDAAVVFVCAAADAALDPTTAYMLGKLKATGHTGVICQQLWSGDAQRVISRLASRP
jgi:hypothetical protein